MRIYGLSLLSDASVQGANLSADLLPDILLKDEGVHAFLVSLIIL